MLGKKVYHLFCCSALIQKLCTMLNILIAIIIESTETLFILHMYRLYIYIPLS